LDRLIVPLRAGHGIPFVGGFRFSTKPLTMIRFFAELSGHYRRSAMIVGQQKLSGGLEDDRETLWLDGRRLPACGHEKGRADEGPPEERSVRV
jgi:hypothetical protein